MIYIHIPFCRTFCTYCDFYSEIASKCCKGSEVGFADYAEALSYEIASRGMEISDDVNTLYIGGGTPSVLPLSVFESIAEALRRSGHGGPFDEFTVEVNPDDIVEKGEAYVEGLLKLGVNRISMGVQSFDDDILKWMNRRHDSAAARRAYAILENAGVTNISIDLIFGLSQLSDAQWSETIEKALGISSRGQLPNHVSAYQLSVEPGSALARLVERGDWKEASDELCEHQYMMLCEALSRAGYHHYEISNFAQPGFEAKHNSAYWTHQPYVGLGPGAHSFAADVRKWNNPDLAGYIAAARSGDMTPIVGSESLTADQLNLEKIMLGLRTSAGVPADFLSAHCDPAAFSAAISSGNLVPVCNPLSGVSGINLRIPESRFFISDAIISELV